MLAQLPRSLVDRVYGFAVPIAGAGGDMRYGCEYCGASGEAEPLPHTAVCPAWSVWEAFARLASRAAAG